MQFLGTEVFRARDKGFWLDKLYSYILSADSDLVIVDDGRFYNELSFIKSIGLAVGVKRDGVTYSTAHESERQAADIVINGKANLNVTLPDKNTQPDNYNYLLRIILETVKGEAYALF